MLKIGDRVESKNKGKGTVVCGCKGHIDRVLVEFDDWNHGHSGNGYMTKQIKVKQDHCYFYDTDTTSLKILSSDPITASLLEVMNNV